jgi:hypothetical protein
VRGGVVGEAPLLGAHGPVDLLLGELEVVIELHRHALPHHGRRGRRRRVHGPASGREEQRGDGVRKRAEEAHALMKVGSIGIEAGDFFLLVFSVSGFDRAGEDRWGRLASVT